MDPQAGVLLIINYNLSSLSMDSGHLMMCPRPHARKTHRTSQHGWAGFNPIGGVLSELPV